MSTSPLRLAIDQELIDRAKAPLGAANNADTMRRAVQKFLPVVAARLRSAGVTSHPQTPQKSRLMDEAAWAALGTEAEQLGVDKAMLLRCCLVLATTHDMTD